MKSIYKLYTISGLSLVLLFTSCKTVKPYERQFVHDTEMQMGDDAGNRFNHYVHSIREGAVPANGPKGSGGCGCN